MEVRCIIVSESSKRDVGLLKDLFGISISYHNFVQATPSMWSVLCDHMPKIKQDNLKLFNWGREFKSNHSLKVRY